MTKLNTRRLIIVLAIVILALAYFVGQLFREAAEPPRRTPPAPPKPQVEMMEVRNADIPTRLEVQGELVAFDKIDIFTEVSGTLLHTEKPFKVGSYFPKGSVLIQVDDQEARLNLLSQKSSLLNAITQMMPDLKIDYPDSYGPWQEYLDNFDPEKPLTAFPKPRDKQEKYFVASRNLHSQYYSIKSAEERLSKFIVRAPFSGVITEATINPGALVRAGQKMGELMNTNNYELVATIPLSDLDYIRLGSRVDLQSRDITGTWSGRVKRISDQVDASTQTVKVFISVRGKALREGMYMLGQIDARDIKNAIRLPRRLLVEQKGVYAVEDQKLRLKPVEVVKITEEYAIVRGLADGTKVLKTPITGAFDGMQVEAMDGTVNNDNRSTEGAIGSIQ